VSERNQHRFYMAELHTRNFEFTAFGRTKEDAINTLRRGYAAHKVQYNATYKWTDLIESVDVRECHLGKAYRDGQILRGREDDQ
jgi:hypothetical protein